jgi:hypothetical protein
MANPNRPGFKPVRSRNGLTSWDLSLAEPYLVDDALFDEVASAICIGHPVVATVTANGIAGQLGHLKLCLPMTDEHITGAETMIADEAAADLVAGVVVGISRIGEMTTFNEGFGQFMAGPDALSTTSKYITSAEVEADTDGFLVWVADAEEWIFEGQIETAGGVKRGDGVDVDVIDSGSDEIVDTTTGRPLVNLDLNTTANAQGFVHSIPRYSDNDAEAADARVWFYFNPRLTDWGNTTAGSTAANTAAS